MRKRRKYVIGYDDDWNCVRGTLDSKALTLAEAKKRKSEMCVPSETVIYELVPVKKKK